MLASLALQAYLAFVMNLHATVKKDLFVEKKGKEDMVLTDVRACLQMEDKRNQLVIGQAKFDALVLQLEREQPI